MTHKPHGTDTTPLGNVLYLALELSAKAWKLAFSSGVGKPRIRAIEAGDVALLKAEIAAAKKRLNLLSDAVVYSCYEAGRDGFWVHRMLQSLGLRNVVVDPASIEVERRKRKRKTDRLDAIKLQLRLIRYHNGEPRVWSVVRVPDEAAEDGRRLHRERDRLMKEKKQHQARIASLLATQGAKVCRDADGRYLRWDGRPVDKWLQLELQREQQRLDLVLCQLAQLQKEREALVAENTPNGAMIRSMRQLKGIGSISSWVLVNEHFGWRPYTNRREASSLVGLTGTPFDSGGTQRQQGISKAGSRRTRALMVELAWFWRRYQPQSKLTLWFYQRWGSSGRTRRIGIVAVARRLFVDLWRFAAHGVVPEGAEFKATKA